MTPRSKHVLIIVLFVAMLLGGLLFAQRAGGKLTLPSDIAWKAGQPALLVGLDDTREPIEMRLEKSDTNTEQKNREELVQKLQ